MLAFNKQAMKSPVSDNHASDNENIPYTNFQDQLLLKALQDIIVRMVDPTGINDISQAPWGPEAGNFLAALREFVSSIVGHSESMMSRHTVVKVSLIKEDNILHDPDDEGDNGTPNYNLSMKREIITGYRNKFSLKEASLPIISSAKLPRDIITVDKNSQHPGSSESSQPTFQDKLLKGLREHVFNAMPIRMLSCEPHGTSLQITLLERGAIYRRLESALLEGMREERYRPKMRRSTHSGRMELETDAQAIKRLINKYARYAILSHTWLRTSGEITYDDWNKGMFDAKSPGYQKLVNFCGVAWKDYGLSFGWMDTVCINKESSSELDESIRSMYDWYSRANVCITYLAETVSVSDIHTDPWFTRGWTLQELLAPSVIKFYKNNWKTLIGYSDNDKKDPRITEQIKRATTISQDELNFIRTAPISRKMQLAATREVTREEDAAYSLMGIFNVSISIAYGEGAQRAFFRLLQEILASSVTVLDIFNWAGDLPASRPHASQILPSSPLHYLNSYRRMFLPVPLEPLTLTHLGLRVPVVLMPALFIPSKAPDFVPIGDYGATVYISSIQGKNTIFTPPNGAFNILDSRVSGGDGPSGDDNMYQVTLAVFNISGDSESIGVNKTCLTKVLICTEAVGKVTSSVYTPVIDTEVPIVFDLDCTAPGYAPSVTALYHIKRDRLAKHGMQLVSLYL